MNLKKRLIIPIAFILILLLATFFRFYHLGTNPPSLFSDENDISYQATTFNRCFTDYFGNKLPFHFHSYSDWQPPLYIYSVAVSQKIFGISPFSLRLPSALYGLLICIVLFCITQLISGSSSRALVGMALPAFSPWLIHFSRTGFGVTGMLSSLLLGLLFWLIFIKSPKTKYLILSVFFSCLSIYFYSTATLFVPLLFIVHLIIWPKVILRLPLRVKQIVCISVLVFILPVGLDMFRGVAGYRFSYISIFSDPTVSKTVDYQRYQDVLLNHSGEVGVAPTLLSKLIHNRPTIYLEMFTRNYINSISPDYLFLNSDSNLRQGFGTFGFLYLVELPFLLLGLALSLVKSSSISKFFLVFLILAPIPFSLTRDSLSPNATRLILMLPPLLYFINQGLSFSITKILSPYKQIFIVAITIIYITSLINFYHFYFYHYPQLSARSWHTGMSQAINIASKLQHGKVYYSNKYEPFLPFFLNTTHYVPKTNSCNPAATIVWDNTDFFTGVKTDNQNYFGQIEWGKLSNYPEVISNSIFVVPQSELLSVNNSISSKYHLNILARVNKSFTEQEEFTIFSLTDENTKK